MRKFIVTPLEEPLKDRMESPLWMALKMAVNSDVTRVSYLFRQVGCVKNEFWPKVGIFLVTLEYTQVDSDTQFI